MTPEEIERLRLMIQEAKRIGGFVAWRDPRNVLRKILCVRPSSKYEDEPSDVADLDITGYIALYNVSPDDFAVVKPVDFSQE